jgi:hypothetical protein
MAIAALYQPRRLSKIAHCRAQYPGLAGWDVLSLPMIKDMVWAAIIALTAVSASNMLLWAWEAL